MKTLTVFSMIAFVAIILVISGCGKSQGITPTDTTKQGTSGETEVQQNGATPVTEGYDFDQVAEDEVNIGELV